MTIFQSYLANARIKKVLNKQPGEAGFSLIELVVVVAVLAILAAVAIPNFLSVSKDGQIAAAKNTLATIIKECTANDVKGNGTKIGKVQSALAKLNGYVIQDKDGAAVTKDSEKSCYTAEVKDTANGELPTFKIGFATGTGETEKTCALIKDGYDPGKGSCDEDGGTTMW